MQLFKPLTLIVGVALGSPAYAGTSTIAVTPGSGATYAVGTNGSSQNFGYFGICDFSACALGANVTPWGSAPTNALGVNADIVAGSVTAASSGALTNPSVAVSLGGTTTAYATGQLLCSSATSATCQTSLNGQSFAIANTAGGASIPRLRIYNNDPSSTAWASAQVQVDLWTAAPTLGAGGGDKVAFFANMATGSASHYASYSCTFSAFAGDGVYSSARRSSGMRRP